MKIGVIIGEFHKEEMEIMLAEVQKVAKEKEMKISSEIWVPGSLEVPLILERMMKKEDIDGVIVLGIIERGETKHGMVMGQSVTDKILDIQIQNNKPVGMGILGPEILPDQIAPRVVPYARAAAEALYKMLHITL